MIYNEQQLHFHDHEQIIKGFDYKDEFLRKNEYNDVDKGFYILPDDKISSSNDFIEDLLKARDFISSLVNSIKGKVTVIIIVIVSMIIIFATILLQVVLKGVYKN